MMMGFNLNASSHVFLGLIWLVFIGLGIWLLASLFPRTTDNGTADSDKRNRDSSESALQILNRRYARGEISQEQYVEMRYELKK